MRTDIHPKNYTETAFSCRCGAKFTIKSCIKADKMSLDVCSECHPFYTGKANVLDRAGRIDKFKKKYS